MSKKREPLISLHQIDLDAQEYAAEQNDCYANDYDGYLIGGEFVQAAYEAARAKDAELIQRLFDALARLSKSVKRAPFDTLVERDLALAAAEAAGFKPSGR